MRNFLLPSTIVLWLNAGDEDLTGLKYIFGIMEEDTQGN